MASLAIFLPPSLNWICLPGTFLFAASMIGIAFGRQPLRRFLRALLVFLGSNALFTGTMTLLWYFVAPRGLLVRNNVVYYDCSPWMLLGLLAVSYTVLRVGEGWLRRRKSPGEPRLFRLSTAMGEVSLRGMVDTGNLLTEAFSGLPVVVVAFDRVKNLLPASLWSIYGGDLTDLRPLDALPEWKKHFRLLPVASVSGKGILPSFRGVFAEKASPAREVCVAVCREPLGEGEIDALLPENL